MRLTKADRVALNMIDLVIKEIQYFKDVNTDRIKQTTELIIKNDGALRWLEGHISAYKGRELTYNAEIERWRKIKDNAIMKTINETKNKNTVQ